MYGFRGDPDSGAVAYRVVASRRGGRGREVSSSTRTPQSPPTRLARAQAEGRIRSWSHGHAPRWGDGDLDAGVAIRAASPGGTSASPSRPDRRLLRIEVTDTRGDDLPCHRPMSPDTESGRGLLLVEALADRWGVELGPAPEKPYGSNSTWHRTHRSLRTCAPVGLALFPKDHEAERNLTKPHPPAHGARSLARVNITNSAGLGTGWLLYAQRDTTQPQTCDGPRRDGNPSARA